MCCTFSALTFDWRIEQCEVNDRRMGKIKLKKVVFVTFLAVFLAIFECQPIRTLDLIEIND